MATLVKKFKSLIEISDNEIDLIYTHLFCNKYQIILGNSVILETDMIDRLTLSVVLNNISTTITFDDEMYVEVEGNSSKDEFSLDYNATKEWIFQLETKYNLGFIEHKYLKYFKKLHELYRTEDD